MIKDHDLQKEFARVTDVFTGADGGIDFIKLSTFLNMMNERAKRNDKAALQVILQFRRFVKLVNIATN